MLSDFGLVLTLLTTFWVFIPTITFIVVMFILVAYEREGYYFSFTIVIFGLILQFFAKIPIFEFLVTHWILALILFIAYLPFGILYARYYELPRFCRRLVERYKEDKEALVRTWSSDMYNQDKSRTLEEVWLDICRYKFPEFQNGQFSIKAYKHKIFTWIFYWPWFFVWRLIHDFLKELWDIIYVQIQHIFQQVTDKIYKDILVDMRKDNNSKM